jgi:DNA invertase Pin-like site-specific DNA recombinase
MHHSDWFVDRGRNYDKNTQRQKIPEGFAMTGKRIGYVRVSTILQNTVRQLDGILLDKTFTDRCSGRDTNRPQLQLCLEFLREGDLLIVHSMDRLARSIVDLRQMIDRLTAKGVQVQFIKENLTFNGKDSLMANLMLSIMGAVAEFELGKIAERRDEGIVAAKKAGKYLGRAPAIRANNGKEEKLLQAQAEGLGVADMARAVGVSRQTIYSWLAARKASTTQEVAA